MIYYILLYLIPVYGGGSLSCCKPTHDNTIDARDKKKSIRNSVLVQNSHKYYDAYNNIHVTSYSMDLIKLVPKLIENIKNIYQPPVRDTSKLDRDKQYATKAKKNKKAEYDLDDIPIPSAGIVANEYNSFAFRVEDEQRMHQIQSRAEQLEILIQSFKEFILDVLEKTQKIFDAINKELINGVSDSCTKMNKILKKYKIMLEDYNCKMQNDKKDAAETFCTQVFDMTSKPKYYKSNIISLISCFVDIVQPIISASTVQVFHETDYVKIRNDIRIIKSLHSQIAEGDSDLDGEESDQERPDISQCLENLVEGIKNQPTLDQSKEYLKEQVKEMKPYILTNGKQNNLKKINDFINNSNNLQQLHENIEQIIALLPEVHDTQSFTKVDLEEKKEEKKRED